MARIFINGDFEEWADDDPRVRANNALRIAAEKVGAAGYNTSDEIKDLQNAMSDVLAGVITPEEAMAMLHYGDTGYLLDKVRK